MPQIKSLQLSPKYHNEVQNAFRDLAITQEQFAAQLGCSRQTISKFFNNKPIDSKLFVDICRRLKLEWQKVSFNYQCADNSDENAQQSKFTLSEKIEVLENELYNLIEAKASSEEIDKKNREIKKLERQRRKTPILEVGYKLSGRYKLRKLIDAGGFASVWRAVHKSFGEVAIKVLHSHYANDPSQRNYFFQGAEAMKKLNELECPNIVKIIEPQQCEDDNYFYFVMEFINGKNLHQTILDKSNPILEDDLIRIIGDVSKALSHAHKHGIIHKDVKPQNILISNDGKAYLTDFNLVLMKSETERVSTGSIGSFIYASPEALGYKEVDERGDVYSLGMTAIFCLYGNNLPPLLFIDRYRFINEELDSSPELKAALLKAVELESGKRFADIDSFYTYLLKAWEDRNKQLIQVPLSIFENKLLDKVSRRFRNLKPFWIGKFTVTNTEYSRFVRAGGYTIEGLKKWWSPISQEVWQAYQTREEHPHITRMRREDESVEYPLFWNDRNYNHPAQPVVGVGWYEADAYCKWLLEYLQMRDPNYWSDKIIALPSEVQWEFAACGLEEYTYPWGNLPPTKDLTNFANKNGTPSIVGMYPKGASWIGCHDMAGNVWEWCRDFYGDSPQSVQGIDRCIRGGCFFDDDIDKPIRISHRTARKPTYRHSAIGFRIVVESLEGNI